MPSAFPPLPLYQPSSGRVAMSFHSRMLQFSLPTSAHPSALPKRRGLPSLQRLTVVPQRIDLSQNNPVRSLVRSGPLPVQYGLSSARDPCSKHTFAPMIGQQLNRSRRWEDCRLNGGRGGKTAPNTSQKTASSSGTGASLRWMLNLIAPYRTVARSWGKKWLAWVRRGHS